MRDQYTTWKGHFHGRVSPAVTAMIGIPLLLGVFFMASRPPKDSDEKESSTVFPKSPSAPETTSSPSSELVADPPMKRRDIDLPSLGDIQSVTTSEEAAAVHTRITQELVLTLQTLSGMRDRTQIKNSVEPLAQLLNHLNRRVVEQRLEKPGPNSLTLDFHDPMERILALWSSEPDVAETVDHLFREHGLLGEYTLAETLNRWISGHH